MSEMSLEEFDQYCVPEYRELVKRHLTPQYDELLGERRQLVRKKFFGSTLSDLEQAQLAFAEFKLDLIEDADLGPALDDYKAKTDAFYETSKALYEKSKELRDLAEAIRKEYE